MTNTDHQNTYIASLLIMELILDFVEQQGIARDKLYYDIRAAISEEAFDGIITQLKNSNALTEEDGILKRGELYGKVYTDVQTKIAQVAR